MLCLGCLLCFLAAGNAGAVEMELFKPERFQGGPWRIKADRITYDAASHTYDAQGKVEIRQGDRRLQADRVEVNLDTKIARVRGNVVLVQAEDVFTGQEGQFNLATRCGEMYGARLFLTKNHFHVESPLIRKTGEKSYYAEEATITTCDADLPVWSFTTRRLSVVLEGYARGREGSFRLAGIPVLYLPVAVFPVMTARQSGFLTPSYGQHRAGGAVVELPFYWAIDDFSDLTLFQTVLSNRGYMQGVEYRRRGHREAASNFRFFYLNDSYTEATTNRRYWAAGMVDQPLGDWNLRGTLDQVSDFNYLRDFNFGYIGLNRYSRDLLQEFGRDLEQDDVNTRVSTLLLARNFSFANLTAYTRYYDRLIRNDPNLYNRLPGLHFQTVPLPLGKLPLYLEINSSYHYFYQDRDMRGDRLELHPRLWLQGQPLPGLTFSSRVGFRETLFRIDESVNNAPPDGYVPRQLFDSKVTLGGAFARDFGRDSDSTGFLRHIVRPEITYWNIPWFNPNRYPPFDPLDLGWVARVNRRLPVQDGDDPIGGVNAITYGISNNILRRGQTQQGLAAVQDLLWFRVSQSSFFNKTSMGLDGTPQRHHPFSDFWGEMEFYPLRRLILGMNMGISPYQEGFDRADFKVTFMDRDKQNYLNVNYIFVKDFAKQINVTTYLNLLRSVKTWLTFGHTFETNNKLERRYGVVLQRQCLGVMVSYIDRPDDQRIGVTVFIPGLGEQLKRSPVRFPMASQSQSSPDLF